ncbi:ABC transporter permease, partial [Bacteroidota bacterium]
RVNADGLISFNDVSLGTAIFGIDPDKEKTTTHILNKIKAGKFFDSDSPDEIVVGYKLLKNLKAEIGDEVVILSQGYDGSLGNLKFKIIGTFKMGMQEFDAMGVFMSIDAAQDLLALYGNIHAVAIKLDDLTEIEYVSEQLNEKIENDNIAALTWEEVLPDLKQMIEMDNASGIIMLLVLILIVTFGILNTVLMSITERFNEFGVTLSIGMPQLKLVWLVLIETIFLTMLGILFGDIIGWGINYYIVHNPIVFGGEYADMWAEYGFLPVMESSVAIGIFINISITILIVSVAACLYPLIKVFRLEPLKGIRYT